MVPGRDNTWRRPAVIINESDSSVQKSDGWTYYSALPGFEGGCLYATASGDQWIDYNQNITQDGWYEVYAFIVQHWNAAREAPYIIYHSSGVDTVLVDQSKTGNARWYKLGDYYFTAGQQKILRLSNANTGSHIVFTDAIMLLNTNRISAVTGMPFHGSNFLIPEQLKIISAHPNPFNSDTTIRFAVSRPSPLEYRIFDVLGRLVKTEYTNRIYETGEHEIIWNANEAASGLYFVLLNTPLQTEAIKVLLLK